MQGPGSLGASGSIAALRYLRELVLDNVVLHAQVRVVYGVAASSMLRLLTASLNHEIAQT
jgi:hypothetical protein